MRTAVRNRNAVVWGVLLLTVMVSPRVMAMTWGDGGTYDITTVVADTINYVNNSTTVNVLEGGEITGITYVSAGATVNVTGGAVATASYGSLAARDLGTVNVYSGTVGKLDVGFQTSLATVYGTAFKKGDTLLDPSVTQITAGVTSESFVLSVLDEAGEVTMTIPVLLNSYCSLNLGWPQPEPEIQVYPALLVLDLGDVEVGESTTGLVQIYNFGTADLNVSEVSLTGDADFTLTSGPATPLVIAPDMSVGVDYEVTFTPSAEGSFSAVVTIVSDDADESVITVNITGTGIITEVPPTQQIQDILDYFDASVAVGTLVGYGPGNSPEKRLNALHNMIEAASDLINAGDYESAIDHLDAISKKTDGVAKPQDFVVGDAVAELNAMIEALIADLAG